MEIIVFIFVIIMSHFKISVRSYFDIMMISPYEISMWGHCDFNLLLYF